LHESVRPLADQPIIDNWPSDGIFIVPVQVDPPPNDQFQYDWFEDYNYVSALTPYGSVGAISVTGGADGGVVLVDFQPSPQPPNDDLPCHEIEFLVAHQFNMAPGPTSDLNRRLHTPDSLGGDSVTWLYAPGGLASCTSYDAGLDGAFPPADAGLDGLPIVPE
jgi:hypothetical protein